MGARHAAPAGFGEGVEASGRTGPVLPGGSKLTQLVGREVAPPSNASDAVVDDQFVRAQLACDGRGQRFHAERKGSTGVAVPHGRDQHDAFDAKQVADNVYVHPPYRAGGQLIDTAKDPDWSRRNEVPAGQWDMPVA